MRVSFNELKSMAKSSARGAGFDWGYSEEIAFATVWLSKNGFNATEVLLTFLDNKSIYPPLNLSDEIWSNDKGDLDPVKTGAALLDLSISRDIVLENVFLPVLIIPFISQITNFMIIDGSNIQVLTENNVMETSSLNLPLRVDVLKISKASKQKEIYQSPIAKRCYVDDDVWVRLEELTYRTYAPETEESRMLGAGAGLSDND